jgi:excisionase family DNA binding protein
MNVALSDEEIGVLAQRVAGLVEGTSARQWFDVHEAADYLCTTPDAIRALVKRGQLEPTRRKPHYLFARETLDAWARDS